MFPSFDVFGVSVYSFGLSLSIAFVVFFWLLSRLSFKLGINTQFFLSGSLWFFLSSFFFARFFWVLAEWRDFQFIFAEGSFSGLLTKFSFMSDYNMSLAGGIFGFLLVLFLRVRQKRMSGAKFIDAVVLAFLLAAVIGYIGAFLGGQIMGTPTELPIGITYPESSPAARYSTPVFPLALVYSLAAFCLFAAAYIFRALVHVDGLAGYIAMGAFAAVLFMFEGFNASDDMFRAYVHINLTQIAAIGLFLLAARGLYKIIKKTPVAPIGSTPQNP